MSEPTTQNPPAISKYLRGGAILIVATFMVYAPAIAGAWIWDDPEYLQDNLPLRSLHGLWQIWTQPSASPQYYPLVFSSFWLEYHLWGLWPTELHTVNIALHLTSALLIWKIMDQLALRGGWLAAAIFALHPVHVESVAWISERKNVLSTVFYLLALQIYLRPFTPRRWGGALALFLAALLSKSVTATWPAAVLVILWWRDGRVNRREIMRLLPFVLLALLSGAFTAYIEHALVGASGKTVAELNLSFADRVLIAGRAVWFYAGKLIAPWPLTFIYPRWNLDARAAWQWIFPASVISALLLPLPVLGERAGVRVFAFHFRTVLSHLRGKPSPQPSPCVQGAAGRNWLAMMLLFVGSLFPALGFVNVYPMRYSFVADHFQYLASIALIVPIAWALTEYLRRAAVLVLLALGVLTFIRAGVFAGPLELWTDTYAKNPSSWMVCTNLGNTFTAQRQFDAAGDLYLRAYELAPQLYDTQTNAAIVFARRGQTGRAIELLESSARINPNYPITYFNWAQTLENSGDIDGAIGKYRRTLELMPEFLAARQRMDGLEFRRRHSSTQRSGNVPRE